jgi:hypothetical protein
MFLQMNRQRFFFIIYHLIILGIYPINKNKFYVCEIKVCFKLVVSIKYKFIYLIYSRLLNKYIIKLLKGRVGLASQSMQVWSINVQAFLVFDRVNNSSFFIKSICG